MGMLLAFFVFTYILVCKAICNIVKKKTNNKKNQISIICPNSFILSGIQKEISGREGGLFCGYTKTGLLEYNYELKQILKNKFIEKNNK